MSPPFSPLQTYLAPSFGFHCFMYVIDCMRVFAGKDMEDRMVKFGFSTIEN